MKQNRSESDNFCLFLRKKQKVMNLLDLQCFLYIVPALLSYRIFARYCLQLYQK